MACVVTDSARPQRACDGTPCVSSGLLSLSRSQLCPAVPCTSAHCHHSFLLLETLGGRAGAAVTRQVGVLVGTCALQRELPGLNPDSTENQLFVTLDNFLNLFVCLGVPTYKTGTSHKAV